jgi:uncharacterized protein YidB (DUF937 family)
MARGFPSMTALLGLLAVAGFQNREKISEYLRGSGHLGLGSDNPSGADKNPGGFIQSSLGELMDKFKQTGLGDTADSWVGHGQNQNVTTNQLEQSLGADTLDELTQKTGLTKDELLSRLAATLPKAVDSYTPQGRLPREGDV